jgi:hypothetical protein
MRYTEHCQKGMDTHGGLCNLSTANVRLPHRRSHASQKPFTSQYHAVPKALVVAWSTVTHILRDNPRLGHRLWCQWPGEDYYSCKSQTKLAILR